MENTASTGDPTTAVSNLWLVYTVAGNCQVVVLTVGWIWGFGFAPADYQQGNSYRIIYLHVPAAIWSMGIYASMAVAAFIGLVWQMKMANLAVAAMAPIGAVFTFIAWLPALHGENRCGAPGGYGMHV